MNGNFSPEHIAKAIMKSVPKDARAACEGDASPETLRWLATLEEALAADLIPEAFHEYTDDYSWWRLVSLTRGEGNPIRPQPGYVPPHEVRSVVDLDWSRGEAAWNAHAADEMLMIAPELLADDDACFEFAERLRRAFADTNTGFEAMRLLRAAVGEMLTLGIGASSR